MRLLRRFARQVSGGAAIEFALIAPVLLLFTFGITELGRAFFLQQNLVYATDRATRLLYITPTTSALTLKNTILANLFLADPKRLTVTVAATTVPVQTGFATLSVQVTYDFNSLVPKLVTDHITLAVKRSVIVRQ